MHGPSLATAAEVNLRLSFINGVGRSSDERLYELVRNLEVLARLQAEPHQARLWMIAANVSLLDGTFQFGDEPQAVCPICNFVPPTRSSSEEYHVPREPNLEAPSTVLATVAAADDDTRGDSDAAPTFHGLSLGANSETGVRGQWSVDRRNHHGPAGPIAKRRVDRCDPDGRVAKRQQASFEGD